MKSESSQNNDEIFLKLEVEPKAGDREIVVRRTRVSRQNSSYADVAAWVVKFSSADIFSSGGFIEYMDSENDWIMVCDNEDWQEALKLSNGKSIRLRVRKDPLQMIKFNAPNPAVDTSATKMDARHYRTQGVLISQKRSSSPLLISSTKKHMPHNPVAFQNAKLGTDHDCTPNDLMDRITQKLFGEGLFHSSCQQETPQQNSRSNQSDCKVSQCSNCQTVASPQSSSLKTSPLYRPQVLSSEILHWISVATGVVKNDNAWAQNHEKDEATERSPSYENRLNSLFSALLFKGLTASLAQESAEYYGLCTEVKPQDADGWYNLACSLAKMGGKENHLRAIKALEHAVAEPCLFDDTCLLQKAKSLEALRSYPAFEAILKASAINSQAAAKKRQRMKRQAQRQIRKQLEGVPTKCTGCNYITTGIIQGYCCRMCAKSSCCHGPACQKIKYSPGND